MDMEKVINYVNTNRGNGRKESLDRLFKLLDRLGNPHKNLQVIHITGTNGKGSTSAFFAAALREANLTVGVFTSPHLEQVNERIRINDDMISDEDFTRVVKKMEPIILELEDEMDEKFYAFELLTTAAFLFFQEKKPDIILLEAGIGGRLDSTNVIEDSLVSVITSIGLDHMKVLGDTKEDIFYEKAQILKEHGHLIVGPIDEHLQKIAKERAKVVDASVTFMKQDDIQVHETTLNQQAFDYKDWKDVKISMVGKHQIENACLVLEAYDTLVDKGVAISQEAVLKGLEKAAWPGRFEKVLDKPLFYIDGAHNLASVQRLIETLEDTFPDNRFHFVVGMMKDKEYTKMLSMVQHLAKSFVLVSPDPNRGFDVNEVAEMLRKQGVPVYKKDNIAEVLTFIQKEIPKEDTVIQFGSLYLVGDIKRTIQK